MTSCATRVGETYFIYNGSPIKAVDELSISARSHRLTVGRSRKSTAKNVRIASVGLRLLNMDFNRLYKRYTRSRAAQHGAKNVENKQAQSYIIQRY